METDRLVETKNEFAAVANHLRPLSDVEQSDDGRYRLGIYDDGPGLETRPFAASVMARERPPPDGPEMRRPGADDAGTSRKNQKREFANYTPRALRLQGFSGRGT